MAGEKLTVPVYGSHFVRLTPTLVRMERTMRISSPSVLLDAMGPQWSFCCIDLTNLELKFFRHGQLVKIGGSSLGFWVPPFSILKYVAPVGHGNLHALLSSTETPPVIPSEPICFALSSEEFSLFSCERDIFDFLSKPRPAVEIMSVQKGSAVARRVKQFIDLRYRDSSMELREIAFELKTSPEVLSRYFQRSYGLSPSQYRLRVRLRDSLRQLLIERRSVLEAGQSCGISDLSRFHRHFKRFHGDTPGKFRF